MVRERVRAPAPFGKARLSRGAPLWLVQTTVLYAVQGSLHNFFASFSRNSSAAAPIQQFQSCSPLVVPSIMFSGSGEYGEEEEEKVSVATRAL